MGTRRQAREAALQLLYLCDSCGFSEKDASGLFENIDNLAGASLDFARQLFSGTIERRPAIDDLITKCAENWEMERMAVVDRNILRLAAFEIVGMPETPINVVIDEAVEIAKRYSTADSGKFVNGILDKLKTARTKSAGC